MDPSSFTVLVLTVCAIHLASTVSAHLGRWWEKTRPPAYVAKGVADADRTALSPAKPQRSDWYAFFHCTDLTGPEPRQKENPIGRDNHTNRAERQAQQIRRSAHRLEAGR
jgi:hypothetical protein